MSGTVNQTVVIGPSRDMTAALIAGRLIALLANRQATPSLQPIHICVTGGGLGGLLWSALSAEPAATGVRWEDVHVWFSDERFLPLGDVERNDSAVIAAAQRLRLPLENVHSVPGPEAVPDVETAAAQYSRQLAAWARLTGEASEGAAVAPLFVVSVLGIGPDGHVASLFPGRSEINLTQSSVIAVHDSPKPPPVRVSFTRPLIERCGQLWMIVAGAEKAPAVARALAGDQPEDTPAAGLRGQDDTVWFVDEALAAELPPSVM